MSTKCTISYDTDYHLYQEVFDSDNVYLKLDGDGWKALVDAGFNSNQVSLRLDVKLWRKIVQGWLESNWGKHPEWDCVREDEDWLSMESPWLKSLGVINGEAEITKLDAATEGKRAPELSEIGPPDGQGVRTLDDGT
jgi:hypothetical protein